MHPRPAAAEPDTSPGPDAVFRRMMEIARGNVLARVQGLAELERGDGRDEPVVALELMRALTEAGRYAEAHRYGDRNASPPDEAEGDPAAALEGYSAAGAVEAVARLAGDARVVMINEAHHVPQHRAFTLELLRELRRQGFTWFAAETLSELDAGLQERGYPTAASGPYIGEPVYGDLVRTALRLGFRVVAYESPGGIDERERGQAARLVERTLAVDPRARVVVHAGYDHVARAVSPGSPPRMAMRFAEMTGITPLSVDQVRMTEHSAPVLEDPLYRALDGEGRLPRATVFVNAARRGWSADPARFDVMVFHPRTRDELGRPQWLRMNGVRQPYAIPAELCAASRPCLVEARHAAEGEDAVPVDRVYLAAGEEAPALLLPAGDFVVTAQTADGTLLHRMNAHVGR
ncbi:MAG TPA: hypothetical protein VFR81_06565 [Longimicrobium sp.]|nr:hypothetical protein [Longimicrobium sp.]